MIKNDLILIPKRGLLPVSFAAARHANSIVFSNLNPEQETQHKDSNYFLQLASVLSGELGRRIREFSAFCVTPGAPRLLLTLFSMALQLRSEAPGANACSNWGKSEIASQ